MATETIEFKDQLADYLARHDMTHARFAAEVEKASGGFCRPSVAAVQTWVNGTKPRDGMRKAVAKAMKSSEDALFGGAA